MPPQSETQLDRSVLPIPDRSRTGLITYDARDPDTRYPPIRDIRPPKTAPNILVILRDTLGDCGYPASGRHLTRTYASLITLGACLVTRAVPLQAQVVMQEPHRFEISPIGGYQWGGSFDTDGFGTIPAGRLRLSDSFAWGVILSFLAQRYSALELSYLRQDTDIGFDRIAGPTEDLGGFAVNYTQIGGRQEFPTQERIRPFVSLSLGLGIMDPKVQGFGSDTRFS